MNAEWGAGEDLTYHIEHTPTLFPSAWSNELTDIYMEPNENGSSRGTKSDDLALNGGMGFYRIRLDQ